MIEEFVRDKTTASEVKEDNRVGGNENGGTAFK